MLRVPCLMKRLMLPNPLRLSLSLSLSLCLSLNACSQVSFERGATRGEAAVEEAANGTAVPTQTASPTPAVTPFPTAEAQPTPTPTATQNSTSTSATPSPAAVASEPATLIRVASWWKLGGTPASLDTDITACVDKLGATHRPSPAATEVTPALRDCLRQRGWRSLGETAAPRP